MGQRNEGLKSFEGKLTDPSETTLDQKQTHYYVQETADLTWMLLLEISEEVSPVPILL